METGICHRVMWMLDPISRHIRYILGVPTAYEIIYALTPRVMGHYEKIRNAIIDYMESSEWAANSSRNRYASRSLGWPL